MELIEEKQQLRRTLAAARAAGRRVGIVPTMGALHEGHLSLVDAAVRGCDIVVVTVFVNALQFGDPSDLAGYPRQLEADVAMCKSRGVAVVFAPTAKEMYPHGPPETVVQPGALARRYEGSFRPGHFSGVATVVTKLLSIAGECRAYFGEKDFQQLAVVRALVRDLDLSAEIVGCPIVREADGLAMSSRNGRLSPEERSAAVVLSRALEAGRSLVGERHEHSAEVLRGVMWDVMVTEPLAAADYAVVVDPITLDPVDDVVGEVRLLVAATIGPVRLIDNMAAAP